MNDGIPDNGHSSERHLRSAPVMTAPAPSLEDRWLELCRRYLPVLPDDPKWRVSRELKSNDPKQGWKLHLSATILSANDVLQKVAPFLHAIDVSFKAPASLLELSKINSGVYYGYSQIGKFITVYPRSDEESVYIARRLHDLTSGMSAPAVPFDLRFRPGSCLYYRYGAFQSFGIKDPNGTITPAIQTPDGGLIPDFRDSRASKPAWVSDPFIDNRPREKSDTTDSPLTITYRAIRALAQRGKGGVYRAVDFSVTPPRLCIIKEGRSTGEMGWDGRDGYWGIKNEERVLSQLRAAGVSVPRVYSTFELEGNYYLVMECITGENLQSFLGKRKKRLSLSQALKYGMEIANLVSQIHAAGLAWRDCKPGNLIVTKEGRLRPVDFEGAYPLDQPDPPDWRTPDFSPTGKLRGISADLYAIGAVLYFLFTGRIPAASDPIPAAKLRRNLPRALNEIISELLSSKSLPSAMSVVERLSSLR